MLERFEQEPVEPINKGYSQQIIEVIKSGNANELMDLLYEVNEELGFEDRGSFSNSERLLVELKAFLSEYQKNGDPYLILYLGAGVSRLVLSKSIDNNIQVEVTENSSQNVIDKWEQIK